MQKINYTQIKNNFKTQSKHTFFEKICIYPAKDFFISVYKYYFQVLKDVTIYESMQFSEKTFSKRSRSKVLKFLIKKYNQKNGLKYTQKENTINNIPNLIFHFKK